MTRLHLFTNTYLQIQTKFCINSHIEKKINDCIIFINNSLPTLLCLQHVSVCENKPTTASWLRLSNCKLLYATHNSPTLNKMLDYHKCCLDSLHCMLGASKNLATHLRKQQSVNT